MYRTRVGYTGGTTPDPTYSSMGDHTESIEIDFDPTQTSYESLVWMMLRAHRPTHAPYSRQYRSAILVHDDEQCVIAERVMAAYSAEIKQPIYTAIEETATFYLAEDYHQKYSLQSHLQLMRELRQMYPDFHDLVNSTAAARLNGYSSGYGDQATLSRELPSFGLSEAQQDAVTKRLARYF